MYRGIHGGQTDEDATASSVAVSRLSAVRLSGSPWRLFTAACLLALPCTAHAQAVQLRGTVINAQTQKALEGAQILLFAPDGAVQAAATSDSAGGFSFEALTAGRYTIRVLHIGFAPARGNVVNVAALSTTTVLVPLSQVVTIEGVTVTGNALPEGLRIREFETRRRMHIGTSFNRDDFERLYAEHVLDLLVEVDGFVRLGGGSTTDRSYAVNFRRCTPAIWIDGFFSTLPPNEVIENLSLWNVYGVEVFRNASEIPGEYTVRGPAGCGLILIWTRRMEP